MKLKKIDILAVLDEVRLYIETMGQIEVEIPHPKQYIFDDFTIDTAKCRVIIGEGAKEKYLHLSPKEYKLLVCLVRHRNMILTREQIIECVWGWEAKGINTRVVDVYLGYLKKKLNSKHIVSRRGFGYMFEVKE